MTADFSVLIVEDDFHVGRLHAGFVDAVPGFSALPPAPTAAQGLKAIHSERPDLVLLDVYLPDASGLDLLRSIDVDAMMLSAASDPDTLRSARRHGALAYLIKPFSAELLASRLRGYARYRRLMADAAGLGQDRLDAAWQALHPPSAVQKPASGTETAVLAALAAREGQSTAEVAAAVGISRTTAQRYLSALADDGAVAISLRYGSTGRPEHRYSVAPR